MHVAAVNPQVVNKEDMPAELVEKEKEIFKAQAEQSGKPAEIIEKMIEGRINKFLAENSLTEQPFVKNPDVKVGKLAKKRWCYHRSASFVTKWVKVSRKKKLTSLLKLLPLLLATTLVVRDLFIYE